VIDFGDPLLNWLLNGAFVYFKGEKDAYEIVAINAFYQGVSDHADNELVMVVGIE
jgi:hypothetical protein